MTTKTIESASVIRRHGHRAWMRCTPVFVTLVNIFVMTAGLFAVVMANSIILAREEGSAQLYADLAIIAIVFSGVAVINVALHIFYGRFDTENKKQRHWTAATIFLLAVGIHIHNVFWFVGAHYSPDTFPTPNYASFSIIGFLFCFFLAIHGWYQLKFANRLFV